MSNPDQKKRVQAFLVSRGYNLGTSGPLGNGVDGEDGPKTWDSLEQYLGIKTETKPVVNNGGVLINPSAFATFAPNALPGTYAALEAAAHKWNLRGLGLIHWLGQMHVESGGFSTMVESLNYSVDSLKRVFGRHRISEADCLRLGRTTTRKADQKAIANLVYGGQWGKDNLGNRLDHPNDGWDQRGSGFKQITGYVNITKSGYTAEQLRTDVNASADAAAWYFASFRPKCLEAALLDDVVAVTKGVNGGTNGLEDRKVQTQRARSVIHA